MPSDKSLLNKGNLKKIKLLLFIPVVYSLLFYLFIEVGSMYRKSVHITIVQLSDTSQTEHTHVNKTQAEKERHRHPDVPCALCWGVSKTTPYFDDLL